MVVVVVESTTSSESLAIGFLVVVVRMRLGLPKTGLDELLCTSSLFTV